MDVDYSSTLWTFTMDVHYGRVMFVNELVVVLAVVQGLMLALVLALVLTVLSVDWPVLARCETSALICGLIAGA